MIAGPFKDFKHPSLNAYWPSDRLAFATGNSLATNMKAKLLLDAWSTTGTSKSKDFAGIAMSGESLSRFRLLACTIRRRLATHLPETDLHLTSVASSCDNALWLHTAPAFEAAWERDSSLRKTMALRRQILQ